MNIHDKSRYHEVHARSLADPEGFWGEAAREIDWIEPAKKVFDPSMGIYGRWLKVRTWFELFPFYRRGMFRRQKTYMKSERLR